jgi:hypothetical protein
MQQEKFCHLSIVILNLKKIGLCHFYVAQNIKYFELIFFMLVVYIIKYHWDFIS